MCDKDDIKDENNIRNRKGNIKDYEDLKNRSFFIVSHSKNVNINENETHKRWKKFIEINNDINDYINLLNNRMNIFDIQNKIILKIENDNLIDINNNKNTKDIINEEKNEYEKEKNILSRFYPKNKYIRFFYDRQLCKLYKLIISQDDISIKKFISSIFNNENIQYSFRKINFNFNFEKEDFENKLNNISEYFSKIITDDTLKKILKSNEIKVNNYNDNTIYLRSFHNDDFESDCIEIYWALTNNLPQYLNLLIYKEETVEEEILSFIYRFKTCEYKSLFTLVFKDKVINKQKNKYLFDNIKAHINKNNNRSILLILYSEKSQEIIFDNIKEKEYKPFELPLILEENNIKENIKAYNNNISIIYSEICGGGKTEYIKSTRQKNEKYVYFSLGGYLTEKELLNKIKNSINNNGNIIFHIDLSESIFGNIIKEFFFKFLILKYYGYNDKMFCYDRNKIRIKIELPNSYIDYFNKYKILKYFSIEKKIDKKNLALLKEDSFFKNFKNYKIQIVSNVLKNYINNKIKIKNINLNFNEDNNNNSIYLPISILKDKEYDSIINKFLIKIIKKFKNKNNYYPNFYQKNIFINFLYSEFEKFLQCTNLNGQIVYLDHIPSYFQNLRYDIIDSLIDNSIYFTFSPFDKIINEEFNVLSHNFQREMQYDEIIEKLQQENNNNIINYEEIEPSILAFHEKGIQFSIICTNKNDKKFKN